MIRRLKRDAIKHHPNVSAYSQSLVDCANNSKYKPVIVNGFWNIGNVQKRFCEIKNVKFQVESSDTWVKLNSWNKCLVFTKINNE